MPLLDPHEDSWRAIDAAVDGLKALAWILLVGMFFLAPAFGAPIARGRSLDWWLLLPAMFVSTVPGIAFFVLARFVNLRRAWAAVAAACLVGVTTLLAVAFCFICLVRVLDVHSPILMVVMIMVGGIALFALGRLLYNLLRAVEAIRRLGPADRGFEPIMSPPPKKKDV